MKENCDYLEMSFRSIQCFANDGKLCVNELNEIIAIAQRDGVVDENERRVLRKIIQQLRPHELTPDMQTRLVKLQAEIA